MDSVQPKAQKFDLKADLPASLVVFLVALPLCLGIALASGAPLFSGIISGVVGGLVIGTLSGSALSVSGPAAGLTVIVLTGIERMGSYPAFLTAVVIAGVIQLVLGFARAGIIGDFFPSPVIRGMLAAIGLILILKQLPHAVGWDADYEGDQSFFQSDGRNTFSELAEITNHFSLGALLLALTALVILVVWDGSFVRRISFMRLVPGPLVAVLACTALAQMFDAVPTLAIAQEHLVSLPTPASLGELVGSLQHPDFSVLARPELWVTAFTIAIVASLETLLSVDAADKIDPLKRITPTNRELKAQGVGQIVAGMLGGLPLTAVIVRSSANVVAGARSKLSAIAHGVLLLVSVLAIPRVLNMIPLAALAAVLILTGYKLCKPTIWKDVWQRGWDQFVPFAVTIGAILFTDLLRGIIAGIIVGVLFILRTNFNQAITVMREGDKYLVSLGGNVSFLNKAYLRRTFNEVPKNAHVVIDGTRAGFIDKDIIETMRDFTESAKHKGINVEMKRSPSSSNPEFKTEPEPDAYPGASVVSLRG